jgi:acyl-CoA reductase-like NAD-dependent aldehyde dehydrogenase
LAAISALLAAGVRAGQQVFLDGEVGEAVAAFHHLHHAALHQVGRGEVLDALAAQLDAALGDLAALALEQVGHGAQRGGLARAVAAQDGHDAAFGHLQRHALEHQDHVVVDDLDAVDVENDVGCAHAVVFHQ